MADRSDLLVGKSSHLRRNCLSLAILASLGCPPLAATLALAQEAPDESEYEIVLEEVIVTGSRIVTEDGFGRTSPVTVIKMEEIDSFGFTRIEDVLNTFPQIVADQTSFISNGATGTATLDLRGLGANRNLVLINGRRMGAGGLRSEAADTNQIPAQMIERVEVLTGGASATYGADAVAGVVNFIMRRVDGVEISAGISGYQHDNRNGYIQGLMDERGFEYPTGSSGFDGRGYNANIVIGGDLVDGRGNVTAYANWRKNDPLLQSSRDYSSCALVTYEGTECGGSHTAEVPNFYIAPLVEGGWGPYGFDYLQMQYLTLQPDSSLAPFDWSAPNVYNYAPTNYFMRPDERWSLGAFADFEIDPHAVVYLETMAMSDHTRAQVAPGGTFTLEVYPLAIDNAYFPENFRRSLEEFWPGENEFGIYIGKRNVEGAPRASVMDHNSLRAVIGVRGLLTGEWDYDVAYLHAETESTQIHVNNLLADRVFTAVDSRLCEADWECIPYEVFTYQGVTAEAANNLAGTASRRGSTATEVFEAYVTGNTGWGLPAGDIMAAAGAEHRAVEWSSLPDSLIASDQLLGLVGGAGAVDGKYSVDEIFVEANIPLVVDHTLARNLTMDLAYRWSDYSTSGGNSTYRLGLDWQLTDGLRVRTGFNRAVRAPSIKELFDYQWIWGDSSLEDYCAGSDPLYSMEQCARSGVTAEQYGHIAVPTEEAWTNVLVGGNPDLDPETADTLTVGLVIDAGRAMRLALDYWNVRIEDAIAFIYPATILEQCALDGQLCELIRRGPDGGLWRSEEYHVSSINWNVGAWDWSGIDVAWDWQPTPNWKLGLVGTYAIKREESPIAGDPNSRFDCAGDLNSNNCWRPHPKWRHTASVTYDSDGWWALTGRWRYYHSINYEGAAEPLIGDSLEAENYFDLNAVFRFMDTHDFSCGVNNLLDEEPPLVGQGQGTSSNTMAGVYDSLGRHLYARVTLRW